MKDRWGDEIKVGDKFIYQIGEEHEISGELFDCGGTQVIRWEDGGAISVEEFYYEPVDMKVLQKI